MIPDLLDVTGAAGQTAETIGFYVAAVIGVSISVYIGWSVYRFVVNHIDDYKK